VALRNAPCAVSEHVFGVACPVSEWVSVSECTTSACVGVTRIDSNLPQHSYLAVSEHSHCQTTAREQRRSEMECSKVAESPMAVCTSECVN
jgi:hypothetical protein